MNFELFDLLRAHIAGLKPEQFDYHIGALTKDGCGCVGAHLAAITSYRRALFPNDGGWMALIRELDITKDEADYIYVPTARDTPDDFSTRGWLGIREALRRLDLVASRYTRPTISDQPADFKQAAVEVVCEGVWGVTARESQFLRECMAVAAQPVEETAE